MKSKSNHWIHAPKSSENELEEERPHSETNG